MTQEWLNSLNEVIAMTNESFYKRLTRPLQNAVPPAVISDKKNIQKTVASSIEPQLQQCREHGQQEPVETGLQELPSPLPWAPLRDPPSTSPPRQPLATQAVGPRSSQPPPQHLQAIQPVGPVPSQPTPQQSCNPSAAPNQHSVLTVPPEVLPVPVQHPVVLTVPVQQATQIQPPDSSRQQEEASSPPIWPCLLCADDSPTLCIEAEGSGLWTVGDRSIAVPVRQSRRWPFDPEESCAHVATPGTAQTTSDPCSSAASFQSLGSPRSSAPACAADLRGAASREYQSPATSVNKDPYDAEDSPRDSALSAMSSDFDCPGQRTTRHGLASYYAAEDSMLHAITDPGIPKQFGWSCWPSGTHGMRTETQTKNQLDDTTATGNVSTVVLESEREFDKAMLLVNKLRDAVANLDVEKPAEMTRIPIQQAAASNALERTREFITRRQLQVMFDQDVPGHVVIALMMLQTKLASAQAEIAKTSIAGSVEKKIAAKKASEDCEARLARCTRRKLGRLCVDVGKERGQLNFLKELLEGLQQSLMSNHMRVYINCRDNIRVASGLLEKLNQIHMPYKYVNSVEHTEEICLMESLAAVTEPGPPVTVFVFDNHFAGFRCTDLICRISDVVVTKPSEFAFSPIPTVHIRHMGAQAVACSFKKMFSFIFNHHTEYFVLVPCATIGMQSISYVDGHLDMGMQRQYVRVAGRWVSSDICNMMKQECELRLARCAKKMTRNFLIAVAAAGAQLDFLKDLLEGLQQSLMSNHMRVYINCGENASVASGLLETLNQIKMPYKYVDNIKDAEKACCKEALAAMAEPGPQVTVFHFDNHFAGLLCTDIMRQIADMLVTKPSDVALPTLKLNMRHEAFLAMRSTELGSGTVECTTRAHPVKTTLQ